MAAIATAPKPQPRPKPNLTPIITRMQYPLAPLHPMPEGAPHPQFPTSILSYHLLTEAQCDSIARYYHQWVTSPCIWTMGYPTTMDWDHEFLEHVGTAHGNQTRLDIKRRKVGRFIGLRGCDTPTEENEERERWYRRKEEYRIKAGDMGYWGRRGFGQW